ncbi:hypothetical protein DRH13_00170 [Candidatus Woesebacteria bacterium]|nr:MAG: hypothetical protein DRH13_00170 [Candidatus Woesebacteria bacterium]
MKRNPAGVDEELWFRAKDLAADAGHENNYPYIMAVYKNLQGSMRNNPSLHSRSKVSTTSPPLPPASRQALFCPFSEEDAGIPLWYLSSKVSFYDVVNNQGPTQYLVALNDIYFLVHAILIDMAFIFRMVQEFEERVKGRGLHLSNQQRTLSHIHQFLRKNLKNPYWDSYNQGNAWVIFDNVNFSKLDYLFRILWEHVDYLTDSDLWDNPSSRPTPSERLRMEYEDYLRNSGSYWKKALYTKNKLEELHMMEGRFKDLVKYMSQTAAQRGKERCALSYPEEMGRKFWECATEGYDLLFVMSKLAAPNSYILGMDKQTDAVLWKFVSRFVSHYEDWKQWVLSHDSRGRLLPGTPYGP